MEKTLFYGDNLDILRKYIHDESVDLIYLDPPFNSKASYNILFKEPSGEPSKAQITAFDDTWHWTSETASAFKDITETATPNVVEMMEAFRKFVGLNDVMAYLTMMCIRLLELRRVLKKTGVIYLHCDPTASHYLKILMDTIFGARYFRNEITWKRTSAHNDPRRYGSNVDIILFYTKSDKWTWNQLYTTHAPEYVARFRNIDSDGRRWSDFDLTAKGLSGGGYEYEYKGITSLWRCPIETMKKFDEEGRLHFTKKGGIRLKRYLEDTKGVPLQCLWDDIPPINSQAQERLGYPTQKPEALLERIVKASSNAGDIVLDPFCGCGTTISVAQRFDRKWIGIDITHLAINLIKWRLKDMFNLEPKKDFKVIGEPEDFAGAKELAVMNRYQFQWWVLSLVNARPYGDKKKGADTGVDGYIYFWEDKDELKKAVVQVKSGNIKVGDVRDLGHVMDREKAEMGIFITLEPPTQPMKKEALQKGFYHSDFTDRNYPRIQIVTVGELLEGKALNMPPIASHIKKAPIVSLSETGELDLQ